MTLPDLDEALADFDEALNAEPEQIDPERRALMLALGLRLSA